MAQAHWTALVELFIETAANMLIEKAREADGSDAVDVSYMEGQFRGVENALRAVLNCRELEPLPESEIEKYLAPFEKCAVERAERKLKTEEEIRLPRAKLRRFLKVNLGSF